MYKNELETKLGGTLVKIKTAMSAFKEDFKEEQRTTGVRMIRSLFVNNWKRGSSRRTVFIACSFAVICMLGIVIGCGGESGSTGESGGAPKGVLAIKGLYVGMPGDRALEAYKQLVGGAKDLMVVDFREGIGPELDEEATAKQKKDWEDTVKFAEADIDGF